MTSETESPPLNSAIPDRMARDGSSGVERTLWTFSPLASSRTRSVNVPPVSTPSRIIRLSTNRRFQESLVQNVLQLYPFSGGGVDFFVTSPLDCHAGCFGDCGRLLPNRRCGELKSIASCGLRFPKRSVEHDRLWLLCDPTRFLTIEQDDEWPEIGLQIAATPDQRIGDSFERE